VSDNLTLKSLLDDTFFLTTFERRLVDKNSLLQKMWEKRASAEYIYLIEGVNGVTTKCLR
jgi:hypothetical protein